MSKDISINEFYSSFCEEISLAQDVETHGWEPQDFFTAVMLGYLEEQLASLATSFTRLNAGSSIPARIAIMAMTTRSSISVNVFFIKIPLLFIFL